MKFSLHMPLNEIQPAGEFQSGEAARAIAGAVEKSGADAGHVSDHPAPSSHWLHNDPTGHDAIDPLSTLAFVAAATTRLKLLTSVLILPYRNPFLTAKAAATVQMLSGGRLILGVGVGYQEAEFDALGVPFRSRGALTDEALETIRLAWAGGPVRKRGRFFNATDNEPRPIPSPQPPIWIAGGSDKAVERAARWGDGWNPFYTIPTSNQDVRGEIHTVVQLAEQIARVKALREQMGRTSHFDFAINTIHKIKAFSRDEADRYCEQVDQFASAGVTWIRMKPPSPSRSGYVEFVAWYGEEIISRYK